MSTDDEKQRWIAGIDERIAEARQRLRSGRISSREKARLTEVIAVFEEMKRGIKKYGRRFAEELVSGWRRFQN